jgi:hypothetical protein
MLAIAMGTIERREEIWRKMYTNKEYNVTGNVKEKRGHKYKPEISTRSL